MMTSFIYAIESAGRIKIGYSSRPGSRIRNLATASPFPCSLLGYWHGTMDDEAAIHKRFAALRTHGEWFDASPELLAFVQERRIQEDAPGSVVSRRARRNAVAKAVGRRGCATALDYHLALLGITDAEFGARAGLSQSQVSRLRRGVSFPSQHTIRRIAEVTGGEVMPNDWMDAEAA